MNILEGWDVLTPGVGLEPTFLQLNEVLSLLEDPGIKKPFQVFTSERVILD